MKNNPKLNKIHVNKEHSLIINDFIVNDTGLYYCKRYEGETDEEEKYNYLVDLIFNENVTSVETGNFTDWRNYYEEYLVPINTLFTKSKGVEFVYLREELDVEMELITQWESWGVCQICGRPKDEGIKKRSGFCRIKISQKNVNVSKSFDAEEKYLKNVNAISCRSQILQKIVPGISNRTRVIPNFIQMQPCEGTCNPDAEGLGSGWKSSKKKAVFKYRKRVVLPEDTDLTVICPESTMETKVVWKKDGKVLKSGESVSPPNPEDEPRIIVDTFNTLYLVGVKESEEGNYTCWVDDARMQQMLVIVVSKARILTKAFTRHMMYLCIILSLTLPCYCAGIIISCHRRRYYKGYQELKEIQEEEIKSRGHTKLPDV